MTVPLPVLMYHSVSADPSSRTRALSVHPAAFAEQLAVLRDGGYTVLTFGRLGELRRTGAPLPDRPVVLTFDDGYADMHEEVLPRLVEHGFPATVFVTTGWIRDAGRQSAGRPLDRAMSWGQVAEVAESGIEVGAHSHSHPQLDQLPDGPLRTELRLSMDLLEQRLGRPVVSLAYPFGYSNRRVRGAVTAAGYRQAAAVANTVVRSDDDVLALPRLTVSRSTTTGTFADIVAGSRLGRVYTIDRMLTRGWSYVRRTRSVVGGVRDHG